MKGMEMKGMEMSKKFTRSHMKTLKEFISLCDGNWCVSVDKWTSGSGWHTTNRAIPIFVRRVERGLNAEVSDFVKNAASLFFKENKRRTVVLVLDRIALFDFLFNNSIGKELKNE